MIKGLKRSKEKVSRVYNVAATGVKNMETCLESKRQPPENAQDYGRKTPASTKHTLSADESVLAGIRVISSTLVEHSEKIEAFAAKLALNNY